MLESPKQSHMPLPTISVVLPVFNKAMALASTLTSLWEQDGRGCMFNLELVLLDDASTDDSVKVAKSWSEANQASMLLEQRTLNSGPSICLNQAVVKANGVWVLVFDADDIAPKNLIISMFKILQEFDIDYLYGRSCKTFMTAQQSHEAIIPEAHSLLILDDPFRLTLKHHIVHPVVMLKREHFISAGGASPQIFIQDESLAFRLARHSSRAGLIDLPCRYVLQSSSVAHLSSNKAQQHHDQYLAAREAWLSDNTPKLWRAYFASKCMSAFWKSIRKKTWGIWALPIYLVGKIFPTCTYKLLSNMLDSYFNRLPGVRRLPNSGEEVL